MADESLPAFELAQLDGSHEVPHARPHASPPPDSLAPDDISGSPYTPHSHEKVTRSMSRAPLLLRSSPALGTGSYGLLPPHLDRTDNEEQGTQDQDSVPRGLGKGKSALRRTFSVEENGHNTLDTSFDAQPSTGSTRRLSRRRQSTSGAGRHSMEYETLRSSLDAPPGFGLGTSFTGSALPGSTTSPISPLANLASSNSSATSLSTEHDDGHDYGSDEASNKGVYGVAPSDDSPYAQVRASVPPYDNISLSINTPRMWSVN